MGKYERCKLRDHQAHALKLNFRMRHDHPRYRIMTLLTLRNALLERSIEDCKHIEKLS